MGGYLLAVDGGGSKTEFCVSDEKGKILFSVSTGPASHKAVGEKVAHKNLQEGLHKLKKKGIENEQIVFSTWGLSGFDTPKDKKLQNEMIKDLGFAENNFLLCNDALLAFYAAATEPGMVIVAGTGSIAYGVDSDGNIKRSGGWGYGFSDLGSGRWIGNEALKETLLYCDGCREYDPLFDVVRIELGAENFDVLPYRVADISGHDKLAALAPLVLSTSAEFSMRGNITERAVTWVADLGTSLYGKINDDPSNRAFQVVLAGGMMSHPQFYNKVAEKLHVQTSIPLEQIVLLDAPPVHGGIRMAMSKENDW